MHPVSEFWQTWVQIISYPTLRQESQTEDSQNGISIITKCGKKGPLKGIKYKKPNSLYLSGLFVDWFNSKDLKKVINESLNKGADGICIFSSEYLNDDHLKTISTF